MTEKIIYIKIIYKKNKINKKHRKNNNKKIIIILNLMKKCKKKSRIKGITKK